MLTWLLQDGDVSVEATDAVADTARRLGHSVEKVRVVPFSHEPASPLPSIDGPCITYGSTGLLQLARRAGLIPGGWDGPTFSMSSLLEAFSELMLNEGAVFCPHSQAAARATDLGWNRVFVKPDSESKAFAGGVTEVRLLHERIDAMHGVGYFDDRDDPVLIAPVVGIEEEWRAFVVDGRVVASSSYLAATKAGAPDHVVRFIEEAVARHAPAPVFVLDIARRLDGQLRIVEANSANSSGFYACDVSSVVSAVSDHVLSVAT